MFPDNCCYVFPDIFFSAEKKRCFIGYFHVKSSRACHPYFMGFLEDFGITEISKSWKRQIYDDTGVEQILNIHIPNDILTKRLLKIPLVYKNPLGMIFALRNSKMTSQLSYNLLVLSFRKLLSKFIMRIYLWKKRCGTMVE